MFSIFSRPFFHSFTSYVLKFPALQNMEIYTLIVFTLRHNVNQLKRRLTIFVYHIIYLKVALFFMFYNYILDIPTPVLHFLSSCSHVFVVSYNMNMMGFSI
jgi:hypothetical protein